MINKFCFNLIVSRTHEASHISSQLLPENKDTSRAKDTSSCDLWCEELGEKKAQLRGWTIIYHLEANVVASLVRAAGADWRGVFVVQEDAPFATRSIGCDAACV